MEPAWTVLVPSLMPSGSITPATRTANVSVDVSRGPGPRVSFQCRYFHRAAVNRITYRPFNGDIMCLEAAPGRFRWNVTSLVLPCYPSCLANYVLAQDEASCYSFLDMTTPVNIVSASLTCIRRGGTLAVFRNASDVVTLAPDGVFFYTFYVAGSTWPNSLDTLMATCDPTPGSLCQAQPGASCGVVARTPVATGGYQMVYKYQSCVDTSTQVACMYPGSCPSGFSYIYNRCFRGVPITGGVVEALSACANMSALLAYPEDSGTLQLLGTLVRKMVINITDHVDVLLGLSMMTGDVTLGGIYSPHGNWLNVTEAPGPLYVARVPESEDQPVALASVSLSVTNLTLALCQFPGVDVFVCDLILNSYLRMYVCANRMLDPTDCLTPPPAEGANMFRVWNNDTGQGTIIIYTCYPGYFVGNDTEVTTQMVACLGQLGGWQPSMLQQCLALDVCNDTFLPEWDEVNTTFSADHRRLNGSVTYTCPPSMATVTNQTVQNATCISQHPVTPAFQASGQHAAIPAFTYAPVPMACDMCSWEPQVENATTTWNPTDSWLINATLSASCLSNHTFNLTTTSLDLECTPLGWQTLPPCYPACLTEPPAVSPGVLQRETFADNAVGSSVTYTCAPPQYFPLTQVSEAPVRERNVTCSSEFTWVPDASMVTCVTLCLDDDPPPAPEGATSDWDNFSRSSGTEVNLTCSNGMKFSDLNTSIVVTCEDDGNWTLVDPSLLVCREEVTVPLPPLPAGMTLMPSSGPYWTSTVLNFSCGAGTMAPDGRTYTTVTYDGVAWSALDPTFLCVSVCPYAAPAATGFLETNYSGVAVIGSAVGYWCIGGVFVDLNTSFVSVCHDSGWTVDVFPDCLDHNINYFYLSSINSSYISK
nr:uncharacterized protein LOC123767463 [Procambarus clarkii]